MEIFHVYSNEMTFDVMAPNQRI